MDLLGTPLTVGPIRATEPTSALIWRERILTVFPEGSIQDLEKDLLEPFISLQKGTEYFWHKANHHGPISWDKGVDYVLDLLAFPLFIPSGHAGNSMEFVDIVSRQLGTKTMVHMGGKSLVFVPMYTGAVLQG